jgi:hypothetical protein
MVQIFWNVHHVLAQLLPFLYCTMWLSHSRSVLQDTHLTCGHCNVNILQEGTFCCATWNLGTMYVNNKCPKLSKTMIGLLVCIMYLVGCTFDSVHSRRNKQTSLHLHVHVLCKPAPQALKLFKPPNSFFHSWWYGQRHVFQVVSFWTHQCFNDWNVVIAIGAFGSVVKNFNCSFHKSNSNLID